VKRVDIVEDPVQLQANTRAGVTLYENGTFEDSTATLAGPGPTFGMVLGSGTVRGSALSARSGIYSHGHAEIERSRLTGVEHGLVALGSLTTLDESLVEMTGPKGAAIRAETTDGSDTSVVGDGLTVIASDSLDTSGLAVTTWPKPAYTLSESARVRLVIRRAGRRGRRVGTLTRSGAKGANAIRFSGRVGRRILRAGRYRATIAATDAAGNRSSPRTIRLRVVRVSR
jgi:hypothetical protein